MEREVDVLGSLNHPNIVKVIDALVVDGWFVMRYYPSGTLSERLKVDPFPSAPAALRMFRSLVEAVAKLHEQGIVHRDIKPENIFIGPNGLVLGDFGIVFFADVAKTRITDTYE